MKPAWLDNLPDPEKRCTGGDVFNLLVSKITDLILKHVENQLNWQATDSNRSAQVPPG